MVGSSKRRLLGGRSGQTILLTAFLLLASLLIAGLAIDLGRYYVVRARLASAVDGGALAGARVLSQGAAFAETAARNFAGMNFRDGFMGTTGHSFSVSVDLNPQAPRIEVDGDAVMPTTLMRLVGIDHVNVATEAEATRRPFAGGLVLDTSGSMSEGNAIAHLRVAATAFLGYFDDTVDQMALVRFQTGRRILFPLGHNFTAPMTAAIANFTANQWTGSEDALKTGGDEVLTETEPTTFRAVIFFTDGRPTAFRDNFFISGQWRDLTMRSNNQYPSGNPPANQKMLVPTELHQETSYNRPATLPDGRPMTNANILDVCKTQTIQAGNTIRSNGITIYAIALGDPEEDQWIRPDAVLMVKLANLPSAPDPYSGGTIVNPDYNPSQPTGGFYFTPDPSELQEVFERIAREISIRLTR